MSATPTVPGTKVCASPNVSNVYDSKSFRGKVVLHSVFLSGITPGMLNIPHKQNPDGKSLRWWLGLTRKVISKMLVL